jgi:P-type Mg2+ transporter
MTNPTGRLRSWPDLVAGEDYPLAELADAPVFTVFQRVASSPRGLTEQQAEGRLQEFGDNDACPAADGGPGARVLAAGRSPFVALLVGLGVVFVLVGDSRGAITVTVMVALAVVLRFWQQTRSVRATRALSELVSTTVTVRRRADGECEPVERELPPDELVPGDIVMLRAGDVVAADLRLLAATDLVVDQAVLSGEVLPVSKDVSGTLPETGAGRRSREPVVDTSTLCFAGTVVVAGAATGVVIATGARTYGGSLARIAGAARPESSFDRGVRTVGWTMVRFMLVMAPIVFAVSGLISGVWAQAGMFAVAVAVGLTPEMLPVVVTTNLARGATRLARERVVVRRLDAIQDLGAMNVLCVDKTGTLTEDRIVYAHSIDLTGRPDDTAAEFAYLAVHFLDGAHNELDDAVAEHLAGNRDLDLLAEAAYTKVDEIGFDHARRCSTVVVSRQRDEHMLICKGDPDHVLPRCSRVRLDGEIIELADDLRLEADDIVDAYRRQGMRVLAVAVDYLSARWESYEEADENRLILAGFVGFVDPVRDSAAVAVASLAEHGVTVKMLTGDSKVVARQVAGQVGLDVGSPIVGARIDSLGDRQLQALAAHTNVFAELTPAHKTRIVAALRAGGQTIGFLGDGVNDVAALRLADAGIATDTATAAAKQAADLILLDKDLAVLARGVVEGRRTLANTMKYVKITASSNFGNVLSVLAASVFLPFLPILPIQLMVQNLLYDTAQLAVAWDRVDGDYLRTPRSWQSGGLVRFMIVFGTLSSVFDLATFALLWWVFGEADAPSTFQTGWFTEGLWTQLLIVLVLRSPTLPWRGQKPATAVSVAAICAATIGLLLPMSLLAAPLRMTALPFPMLACLIAVTVAYAAAAQLVKQRYLRSHPNWL